MLQEYTAAQQAMIDLFQQHVGAEMNGDIETTMATMTSHQNIIHVPTKAGGTGRK